MAINNRHKMLIFIFVFVNYTLLFASDTIPALIKDLQSINIVKQEKLMLKKIKQEKWYKQEAVCYFPIYGAIEIMHDDLGYDTMPNTDNKDLFSLLKVCDVNFDKYLFGDRQNTSVYEWVIYDKNSLKGLAIFQDNFVYPYLNYKTFQQLIYFYNEYNVDIIISIINVTKGGEFPLDFYIVEIDGEYKILIFDKEDNYHILPISDYKGWGKYDFNLVSPFDFQR